MTKLNYENQTETDDPDDPVLGNPDNPDQDTGITKFPDRIRTPDRFIIIPGMSHDYTASETISIIPPLGDSSIHTVYYIMAAISLVVLVVGIFGIKKFVLKK